jgi:hypothetical protein
MLGSGDLFQRGPHRCDQEFSKPGQEDGELLGRSFRHSKTGGQMFEHAVDPKLFLLIERLSKVAEVCSSFYLAGGTGLALQFGHRRSDDLDFFSAEDSPDPVSLNNSTWPLARALLQSFRRVHPCLFDVRGGSGAGCNDLALLTG